MSFFNNVQERERERDRQSPDMIEQQQRKEGMGQLSLQR